jgi:transposase-like protein
MRAEILVGPERRRRWSAEQKVRIVDEAFEPGARVAEVARRRDVSRAQIYQWRAAIRDDRPVTGGVRFVPVELQASVSPPCPEVTSSPDQIVEIGLVGGRILKVRSSLGATTLRRLIRAVERA